LRTDEKKIEVCIGTNYSERTMPVIKINPMPPYRVLPHLKMFSIEGEPVPCIVEGKACRRCVQEMCWKTIVRREGNDPLLEILVFSGDPNKVKEVIKRIYNVELDYNKILLASKKYPELHKIVSKHSGLRPTLSGTMWESLIKTIIMQRIMLKFALRIISRLVKKFGKGGIFKHESFYDFPTPETLKKARLQGKHWLSAILNIARWGSEKNSLILNLYPKFYTLFSLRIITLIST